jgi:(S)-3,5-dihydroxyphenylglycine transaminase
MDEQAAGLSSHRVELAEVSLHGSLTDPVVDSMNFLNEVMDRYPDAISFAPGAPYEGFFDSLDIARYIERYLAYLRDERGLDAARARRMLFQYGPSRGRINELVARALRVDEGIDVAPEAIVVTVGCQEALVLALRVLCASRADRVAVANPAYVGIAGAARLLDVRLVPVGEDADGIDLGRLAQSCVDARAANAAVRAVYVAPDFANPSGTRLGLAARHRLLDVAERHDLLVLEDTAYRFTAEDPLPSLKALDRTGRVVQLGTFAKVCMPGARVGYAVADQTLRAADGRRRLLADAIASAKSYLTVNTSPLSQAVIGGMLLEHGGSLRELSRAKAVWYRRSLRLLLDALGRHLGDPGTSPWPWNAPEGGFFVQLATPVPADGDLVEVSAREYGVLWTPMRDFYLDGTGANRIRLSCSYLTRPQIEEGVARLAGFLRDRCRPAAVTDRATPVPVVR